MVPCWHSTLGHLWCPAVDKPWAEGFPACLCREKPNRHDTPIARLLLPRWSGGNPVYFFTYPQWHIDCQVCTNYHAQIPAWMEYTSSSADMHLINDFHEWPRINRQKSSARRALRLAPRSAWPLAAGGHLEATEKLYERHYLVIKIVSSFFACLIKFLYL